MSEKPSFFDGYFEYEDASGVIRAGRHSPICDFCSTKKLPITWNYPTGPVEINLGGSINASDDDWAACDPCHVLIEQEKWQALAHHCLEVQLAEYSEGEHWTPIMKAQAMRAMMKHFQTWTEARLGPAIPEEEWQPGQPES